MATTTILKPSPSQRVAELEAQLLQRDALIAQLQQRLTELEQRLTELTQAAKRQATPFARKPRQENPKRPGRQAGQGQFTSRTRPTLEEVTDTKEPRLDACPACGGAVTDLKEHEQFGVDLPEVKLTVIRYLTQSGQCATCGRRVRSRHPEQISQATGAAGGHRSARQRFCRRPETSLGRALRSRRAERFASLEK